MDDGFASKRPLKVQGAKKTAEAGLNKSTLRTAHEHFTELTVESDRCYVSSAPAATKQPKVGF